MVDRVKVAPGVHLYLRAGVWWADLTGGARRVRRSLKTTDRAEATVTALDIFYGKTQLALPQPNRLITLSEAVKTFLEKWSPLHHKTNTRRRYSQVLNELVRRKGGTSRLRDLTRQEIVDWQTERSKKVSAHTVNNILYHLRAFISWAQAEGMIERNPCFGIRKLKTSRVAKPAPTPADISKLLEKATEDPYLHDWIVVAFNVGLTISITS